MAKEILSVGRVAERGQITLPKKWRDAYEIADGSEITWIDLGGAFLLRPGTSRIDAVADKIKRGLLKKGGTLESMLKDLRELRESQP